MSGLEWFCGSGSSDGRSFGLCISGMPHSMHVGTVFHSFSSFAQNSPRMDFVGTVFVFFISKTFKCNTFVSNNFFICGLFFIDAFPNQHQMTMNSE
jgi:hypothetical protein